MMRAPHLDFVVTLLVVIAGVAGCSDNASLRWTEDVMLPDGPIITLDRYVEFKGGASRPGDPSTESLQKLSFRHPASGATIRWENSATEGLLRTIALWIEHDTPVLLTRPAYGGDSRKYKCPNPPYLLLAHVNGRWQLKPLADIGLDRLRSNMTSYVFEDRRRIEEGKHHLTAQQTSDSYTYRDGKFRVPYMLVFKGMPAQSFDERNCDYPSLNNLLLTDEGIVFRSRGKALSAGWRLHS